MSWKKGPKTKLTHQDVAEQVLQLYLKSLQDAKTLSTILSECSVLDYFGKIFYGRDKVLDQLISNLHGSNFELSSLSINDQPSVIQYTPVSNKDKVNDDLGVSLISPPKITFPSVTFSTPVRNFSEMRKRSASEASIENYCGHSKMNKTENDAEQSSSCEKTDDDNKKMLLSPQSFQPVIHKDVRYLTAYGTIRFPERVLPTMDLKRIKHHSLAALRGRFCQLYIAFEADEFVISVFCCKIRTIKYSYSSKVTPRNLLKAFNEVDGC